MIMDRLTRIIAVTRSDRASEAIARADFCRNNVWIGFLIAAAFSGILAMMQLALPLYSMQIFDRVIPSSSLPTLVALTLLMAALILCTILLDASRALVLGRLANRVDALLHHRLTFASFDDNKGTSILKDAEVARAFISGPLACALLDVPWSAVFLAAMFLLHPLLGWMTIASAILILLLGGLAHAATRRSRSFAAMLSQTALRIIDASRQDRDASRVMGLQDAAVRQVIHLCEKRIQALSKAYDRQAWIEACCRGVRNAVQVMILGSAAILAMRHQVEIGTIVASSMLFARAIAPIERLGAGFHVVAGFLAAWRRLVSLPGDAKAASKLQLPRLAGHVGVESLYFGVHSRPQPIIKAVNFSVEPGQLLVIVGREGAGKSTLAKLLVGALTPSAGAIRLDGSNIADFPRADLARQMGFLPQNARFPTCTVAGMISRNELDDSEEIVRAAQMAGAHTMIQRLPQGYQTRLDDGQSLQSAGQRQRLLLARAFFRSPKLIVLDEPTAFLDDDGERDLVNGIQELKALGSTIIVVSRFPGLLRNADHLMMLEAGQVRLFADQANMQSFLAPRLATSQD